MSRGHGKVQRAVLDWLAEFSDQELWTLACFGHGVHIADEPTRAQVEATRRALKRLMEQGLVERRLKLFPGGGLGPPTDSTEWVYSLSVGADGLHANTYEEA